MLYPSLTTVKDRAPQRTVAHSHDRTLLWAVAAGVVLAAGSASHAAEITDVADAADVIRVQDKELVDPVDVYFGSDMEFTWESGTITREPIDRPGTLSENCNESNARRCQPVDELRYAHQSHRMNLRAQIGLYHDLAITAELPVYLTSTYRFKYADNVGPQNSSVDPQLPDPNQTLFPVRDSTDNPNTFASKRTGLGNMNLGLRMAILNDSRDSTKPSWVVFFKWGMPYTASTHDPSSPNTGSLTNPGSMGDGVHRLTFGTALSKRMGNFGLIGIDPRFNRRGYTDPYVELSYVLPIPQRGRALRDQVKTENNPFGRGPSHEIRFKTGVEFVPYEDLKRNRRVTIDTGLRSSLFTEGRNYSQLSEALGELTFTEQYLRVQGNVSVRVQAAEYVRLHLGFGGGYVTEHFLTFENVGNDTDGDGQVLPPLSGASGDELNPYFCGNSSDDICQTKGQPSYDQVGFRFKDEQHFFWTLSAGILITL